MTEEAQERPIIGLSFLNAYEYCPRRFYYEFVQGDMLRNEFVLEGQLLHEPTDQPGHQSAGEGTVQYRRVYLHSDRLGINGFADVVEEQDGVLRPVEYKHGKQGKWLNDHVQLCAQALCLEETRPAQSLLDYGYIFYWSSRRRVQVEFNAKLREQTLAVIQQALEIAQSRVPPPPLEGKLARRCADCSLEPLCLPAEVKLLKELETKGELNLARLVSQ